MARGNKSARTLKSIASTAINNLMYNFRKRGDVVSLAIVPVDSEELRQAAILVSEAQLGWE